MAYRPLLLASLLASLLAAVSGPPVARAQRVDPAALASVVDADPLELARVVDRQGDEVVVQGLAPQQRGDVRLAAVRAVPFMDAPWGALPALVPMLAGRDSELAPAAARALLRVAERGDAATAFAFEMGADRLGEVVEALERACADATLRPDLALAAAQAASMLTAAYAPARPPAVAVE